LVLALAAGAQAFVQSIRGTVLAAAAVVLASTGSAVGHGCSAYSPGGAKMKNRQSLGHISPFFIVSDVPRAIRFYEERLGFETRAAVPEQEPFFAIVGRDSVQVYLKSVSDDSHAVGPQPNHARHQWAPWDAFVFLADPDGLAQELASRGVSFHKEIQDTDDGLRGFEVRDCDGYVLFFGRPK
jgi:catechol 2,3-dioxygenase-like lactoylglutathione lyase family enzyme